MKTLFMFLVLLTLVSPVEARNRPLPYTIDTPHVVEKNRTILLEWRQTSPVLVTVYKLSYTRRLPNNCTAVETFGAQCSIIWQKIGLVGNIRVTDKFYRRGDAYFIQQNIYQSHNGGYGPFYPTYR